MSVFTIQKKFPDFSLLMDQMFSDKACLPHLLPCFVMQCLEPQEREIVSAYLTQRRLVPKNIDLTDEATLKEYIRYALGPKDIDLTAPDALREFRRCAIPPENTDFTPQEHIRMAWQRKEILSAVAEATLKQYMRYALAPKDIHLTAPDTLTKFREWTIPTENTDFTPQEPIRMAWQRKEILSPVVEATLKEYIRYALAPKDIPLTAPDALTKFRKWAIPPENTDFTPQEHIRMGWQKKENLSAAVAIAREGYRGGKTRPIQVLAQSKPSYGIVFPINPEVMAFFMQRSKCRVVCELGGASGENILLAVFAGARKAYLNDLEKGEIQHFKGLKQKITDKQTRKKFHSFEGDYSQILRYKPDLENTINLLLCRNLLHFFNAKQQSNLLEMTKKILAPGGQAIFTVNSIYGMEEERRKEFACLDAVSFASRSYQLVDRSNAKLPPTYYPLYRRVMPLEKESTRDARNESAKELLYKSDKYTGYKWTKVDRVLFPEEAEKVFSSEKESIRSVKKGEIYKLVNIVGMFNRRTLTKLFEEQGFEVECTFVTSAEGHLVHDAETSNRGQQLGIVVSKKECAKASKAAKSSKGSKD